MLFDSICNSKWFARTSIMYGIIEAFSDHDSAADSLPLQFVLEQD